MPYTTLIEPIDLAALLRDPTNPALVCDCTFDLANPAAGAAAYAAGHVPGAVYLSLDDDLSGPKTGRNGRHPLPDPGRFTARMAALGVSDATQVVAYDAANGMFAARLWCLMRWIGHPAVAVLNGGLAAWKAAGHPLATTPPTQRPGTLTPRTSLLPTVGYDDVCAASDRLIVDARAPDRFRGENETLDPVGGHIPGASNRFFATNLGPDGRFKPPAALREEFTALLGGHAPASVISQCGSGVTACHNLLAMEVAGLPGASLYPGSWSEYAAQPGAPVATGA